MKLAMQVFPWTIEQIIATMERLGYPVLTATNVVNNIWIRMTDNKSNAFIDWGGILLFEAGAGIFHVGPGTTKPGLYWRQNPMNAKGCACVVPGYYPDVWEFGKHTDYDALRQVGPITVYRDNDKDGEVDYTESLDFYKAQSITPPIETGVFAINSHRESATIRSVQNDKYSAGCMVDADDLLYNGVKVPAWRRQVQATNKKRFPLALLTQRQIEQTISGRGGK